MGIYFEVYSCPEQDCGGVRFDTLMHDTQEEAEQVAREKSNRGFFSSVWRIEVGRGFSGFRKETYVCEYAAGKVEA